MELAAVPRVVCTSEPLNGLDVVKNGHRQSSCNGYKVAATTECQASLLRPLATKRNSPVIISLEAAIGAGKSSLLSILQTYHPSWLVVHEPVELWQNVSGHNLLHAFYENMHRYAFTFQTYCVISRIETVSNALRSCREDTPFVLLERSWQSDRYTFAEMLRHSGRMNPLEWSVYERWFDFAAHRSPAIDGFVFLDCSIKTCMARLKKRSRCEEACVTEEYQAALIQQHEHWLSTIDQRKVCRIKVDDDFVNDEKLCREVVARVTQFVEGIRLYLS